MKEGKKRGAKPGRKPKIMTLQEKRQVVSAYLVLGQAAEVERQLGIPARKISHWKRTAWWKDLEAEVTEQLSSRAVAMSRGALFKALGEINDRLENGDVRVLNSKEGPITHRAPAGIRELTKLQQNLTTQVRLADGKPTSRTHKVELNDTAAQFVEIANQYMNKLTGQMDNRPVIEGESVKVLPGDS